MKISGEASPSIAQDYDVDPNNQSSDLNFASYNNAEDIQLPPSKRLKKPTYDERPKFIEDDIGCSSPVNSFGGPPPLTTPKRRDEFDVYGEHISNELRQFKNHHLILAKVKQKINTTLSEAEFQKIEAEDMLKNKRNFDNVKEKQHQQQQKVRESSIEIVDTIKLEYNN